MTVTLSVSQVRQALFREAGGWNAAGTGAPSTAVLGSWFHEGLNFLVGAGSSASPLAKLADVEADLAVWKRTVVEAAYTGFIGPKLTRERAALHDAAPQVLAFWQAMQEACHWLAELCWSLRSSRPGHGAPWMTLADLLTAEQPLACLLREPGWTDAVRLVGVPDAVVRLGTGAWCAIEFKIGQTSPLADLGQACLYHLMIEAAERAAGLERPPGIPAAAAGSLALVSFHPQRHERLFSAGELAEARRRLVDLVGRLAGVVGPPATESTAGAEAPQVSPAAVPGPPDATQPTAEHLEMGRNLVKTWAEYGVNVSLDRPVIAGPTFIRFPVTLGRGTKVRAVQQHAPELQVRLQLKAEPFIGREDGQLVLDVQRPDRQTVWFDDARRELPPPDPLLGGSHLPVGVDLFRRLVCADLSQPEHAHVLVAGTTGSGKSEWLRLAIAGLIVTNTPQTLRLLVIDPKRNAFHSLRNSPYLWRPLVFPDEQPAADVLGTLAEEMDRRYRLCPGADSFRQLALQSAGPLPRIVCVCDEYRDLISRSRPERKQIEEQICRLGAKARAAGIHLILATQEPSRDTIKGPLDCNMPARVGLKMGKPVESRMLLNESGAEKLLGNGDLLFKAIGSPSRLQAPLMSEANRAAIFGGAG